MNTTDRWVWWIATAMLVFIVAYAAMISFFTTPFNRYAGVVELIIFAAYFSYILGKIAEHKNTAHWKRELCSWMRLHAKIVRRMTRECNQWKHRLGLCHIKAHGRGGKHACERIQERMGWEPGYYLPDWFFKVDGDDK